MSTPQGDKKISEFPNINPLMGDELIEFVQNGVNRKGTVSNLLNFLAPPLSAPASLTATAGDGTVALVWEEVENATGYVLQRATQANYSDAGVIFTGSALTYDDDTAVNGTHYYYRVKATADGYTDSAYAIDDATPEAGIPLLATPALTLDVISDDQINASWLAIPNASSYQLQRADNSGFSVGLVTLYSGTGLSYNNTGLTAATTYYYRLKAVGDGVDYLDSAYDTENATTDAAPSTFEAEWGWIDEDPYIDNSTVPNLESYQGSGDFNIGELISADFHTMPTQNFAVVKEPSTEPVKTTWSDTGSIFNNGIIPDSVFRAGFVVAGFRYYVTRVPMDFDTQVTSRVEFDS